MLLGALYVLRAIDEMYPKIVIRVFRRRSFSDGQAPIPTVLLLRIRY